MFATEGVFLTESEGVGACKAARCSIDQLSIMLGVGEKESQVLDVLKGTPDMGSFLLFSPNSLSHRAAAGGRRGCCYVWLIHETKQTTCES